MEKYTKKIIALLGPTNTGKTYVAIEKMFHLDEKEYSKMRNSVQNYAEKVTNDVSILNQSKELFLNSLGRGNV